MKPIRSNIAGLMAVVALSAFGTLALRHAQPSSLRALFVVALGLGFAAIVLAVVPTSLGRPFAIGYAMLGWGYLAAVALVPRIDGFVDANLTALRVVHGIGRGAGSGLTPYHLLAHSLFDIAAGVAGGMVAVGLVRPAGGE